MFKLLKARLLQGGRTVSYPRGEGKVPDRFRGRPVVDASNCPPDCGACAAACPAEAISIKGKEAAVDLGRCLFCEDCQRVCPADAIRYSRDFSLAAFKREDLIVKNGGVEKTGRALNERIKKLFGRSLKLRQVSAGGCNGCEADINVLNTVVYDLGRFGIQFVASPRHADGLVITGPVTANMKLALEKTYGAVPAPKLVIAVGACAISGGLYRGHPEASDGANTVLPVDLFIPGCPPHPLTILEGLLRLLGRV